MEQLVSLMLLPLCSRGEGPWLVGWVGSRAGLDVSEERRIIRPMLGFEPRFLWMRDRSTATIPTELSGLRQESELHFVNWTLTVKVAIFVPPRVTCLYHEIWRFLTPDQFPVSFQPRGLSILGVMPICERNCFDRRVRMTIFWNGTQFVAYFSKVVRHLIESAFKNAVDSECHFDITYLERFFALSALLNPILGKVFF